MVKILEKIDLGMIIKEKIFEAEAIVEAVLLMVVIKNRMIDHLLLHQAIIVIVKIVIVRVVQVLDQRMKIQIQIANSL